VEQGLGGVSDATGLGHGQFTVALRRARLHSNADNDQKSFLVALDKKTGDELWRVDRDEKFELSTPYIWKNKQRTELITAGGGKLRSYNPDNGELLWEMSGAGRNSLTPVGDQELLYTDSVDRMMGGRGPIVAIRSGRRAISPSRKARRSNAFVAWSSQLRTFRVASPLLYKDAFTCSTTERPGQMLRR